MKDIFLATTFNVTVTDNSAQVVSQEMNHLIFSGQLTLINLVKTVQNSLGPPYSSCNASLNYRQVNCLDDFNNDSQCMLQGPAECNQVNFGINRVDVEFNNQDLLGTYESIQYAKLNTTGMSYDEINKGMMGVFVYFNKLKATEITQSPSMSSTNLVGNVGDL